MFVYRDITGKPVVLPFEITHFLQYRESNSGLPMFEHKNPNTIAANFDIENFQDILELRQSAEYHAAVDNYAATRGIDVGVFEKADRPVSRPSKTVKRLDKEAIADKVITHLESWLSDTDDGVSRKGWVNKNLDDLIKAIGNHLVSKETWKPSPRPVKIPEQNLRPTASEVEDLLTSDSAGKRDVPDFD